jgi:hypothetical protein
MGTLGLAPLALNDAPPLPAVIIIIKQQDGPKYWCYLSFKWEFDLDISMIMYNQYFLKTADVFRLQRDAGRHFFQTNEVLSAKACVGLEP